MGYENKFEIDLYQKQGISQNKKDYLSSNKILYFYADYKKTL